MRGGGCQRASEIQIFSQHLVTGPVEMYRPSALSGADQRSIKLVN